MTSISLHVKYIQLNIKNKKNTITIIQTEEILFFIDDKCNMPLIHNHEVYNFLFF